MSKLLLVEDDANLGTLLEEFLEVKGFGVKRATDGVSAVKIFASGVFDICILDVMLPKKDGFDVCKEIRNINKTVPIIFLTARTMKKDLLEGFAIGGDDYLTKPFSMEELLVRIQALLRRNNAAQQSESLKTPDSFKIGAYDFFPGKQTLKNGAETQKLTSKESDLLRLLCLNLNNTLERNVALLQIWHDDSYFSGRSMDVYITKLRKYLRADPSVEIINVHGTGFKLVTA